MINRLLIFIVFINLSAFGQSNTNTYSATLSGQVNGWNAAELPKEMYTHTRNLQFSDVRLYGIEKNGDTLETPYYIEQAGKKSGLKKTNFKLLNAVKKGADYYFTLQIPDSTLINEIELSFGNTNYNWLIDLEGSNDQKEWFHALEKYRIVAINNSQTSYQFNKLVFMESKYRYFRIRVRDPEETPIFKNAWLLMKANEVTDNYKCTVLNVRKDSSKANKNTTLFFETAMPVPLYSLSLKIKFKQDYYRNATLYSLKDSYKVEDKWSFQYGTIWTGVISSLELANLRIDGPIARKYKLVIENEDNPPLKVSIKGAEAEKYLLFGQLESDKKYFITFGNKKISKPNYDIHQFKNQVPEKTNRLVMGTIVKLNPNKQEKEVESINKMWLWLVMLVVIAILSWFTYKMLTDKKEG
jgi:hypothetical protein